MDGKPNCYECTNRGTLDWSAHSCCSATDATVSADSHGIKNGWFLWPINFDPVWLLTCNKFNKNNGNIRT